MKAASYIAQGSPEVIQIGTLDEPVPGPGEVRVRVRASAVNPSDILRRSGRSGPMLFPRIVPHSDGAGIVDAVGEAVPEDWLRRRVWIYNGQWKRSSGTAAEYICVPVELVVPLPDSTAFDAGATLGIPGCTAHYCVFSDGPVAGRDVLVAGGGGVVARYAIQLAKWGGARVIASVGAPDQVEIANEAGADHVVNYKAGKVAESVIALTSGRGVDRIIEVEFGGNLETDIACLAENGMIAAYFSGQVPNPAIPFTRLMLKNATVRFALVYLLSKDARRRAVDDMTQALEAGFLRPRIGRTYTLEETAIAHHDLETRSISGNAIILLP